MIQPAAAEWAAQRGSANDLAAIETAYLAMAAALPDDWAACCEADVAFHHAVIAASTRLVLKALASTIEAALRAAFVATAELMATQAKVLEAHREVLDAIRFRAPGRVKVVMILLLDIAAEDLYA
jgi:DNA-binding FadR family transcriptional regulator